MQQLCLRYELVAERKELQMKSFLVILAVTAFSIFFIGAGIGILFMCLDGTEIGRIIDEKLAKLIGGGETDE